MKYKQIKINVLPDEYNKLKDFADNDNLKLSGYCRKILNVENDIDKINLNKINLKLIREINYIGKNLNQVVKYINTTKNLDLNILIALQDLEINLQNILENYIQETNYDN